jgi:type IV pilus assembly protein PilB
MSKQLADVLLKDKLITQAQFDQATKDAGPTASPVRSLIQSKLISESKLVEYLSRRFNLASINLAKFALDQKVISLIPTDLVRELQMIPIQAKADVVVVAVCDPTRLAFADKIRFIAKRNVEAVLTTFSSFEDTLNKYFSTTAVIASALNTLQKDDLKKEAQGSQKGGIGGIELYDVDASLEAGSSSVESSGEAVVNFVNGILGEAVRRGASDIHIEPYERRFRVRLRVDGALLEIAEVPPELKRTVVARMKVMSRMDISESRIPQDGRIKIKVGGAAVDFRVNTLPTLFGEKVVLRLLSQGNLNLDMMKLGFEKEQLEIFKKGIYSPNGMVLVTGPTGSGKTTTLYSALSELNQTADNISTAEDPVEYNIEGINQTQVNKDVGLNFAAVLRSLLRQDPDIILVGEIRDYETAEVSIQAALTGHLVLSTLHTNDAPSTITRLMNMGVEPFLVTSSLNTIVAQRLLRKICVKCKAEFAVPKEKLLEIGVPPEKVAGIQMHQGKGCGACGGTGYKGRVAVYEVFDFTQDLKEMVLRGQTVIEIRKAAMAAGMRTLRQSAIQKAIEGQTSLQEAISLTME